MSIMSGWSARLRARLGGVKGCTHMTELLGPVATTAFQTVFGLRYNQQDAKPPAERETPSILNTCHAMASDSPVVKRRWPITGRSRTGRRGQERGGVAIRPGPQAHAAANPAPRSIPAVAGH